MPSFEFDHVGLLAGSSELARKCEKFYRNLLGLKVIVPFGENPEDDFCMLSDADAGSHGSLEIIGQIFEEREKDFYNFHGPGLDHLSFDTENVDEAYEILSAAGVEFQTPPYSFLDTRLACCKDPSGNDIKITQGAARSSSDMGEDETNPINARFSHVGLLIDDAEKALETERFYRDHFGMREIMRGDPNQEGMNWVYLEDSTGRNPFWVEIIGDIFFDQERAFLELHGSGMNHLCLRVEDSAASYEYLQENGVIIEIEPLMYGPARIFFIRDPAGLIVQLTQILDQPEPSKG